MSWVTSLLYNKWREQYRYVKFEIIDFNSDDVKLLVFAVLIPNALHVVHDFPTVYFFYGIKL